MIIIGILIVVLFAVLISWTWNCLQSYNNFTKILYIILSTLIMLFITYIIFCISKSTIQYSNEIMVKDIRNILVLIFTPINGIIIVPFLAKQVNKIKENSIDEDTFKKKIIITIVILVITIIIEIAYLKNIQLGILKLLENMK